MTARGSVADTCYRDKGKSKMTDDRDEHLSKFSASEDQRLPESPVDPRANQSEGGSSRRRFVKAGLTAVPIIFTLRSRPAWGQDPVPITGTNPSNGPSTSGAPEASDGFGALGEESDQTGFFQDPWADEGDGGDEDEF